jgi:Skp family chaperone for outer membrane proteins
MTQTPIPDPGQGAALSLPPPPRIPAAEELYDQIMGTIEADLTTANLQTLNTKYAGETPEQSKVRSERYAKAFAEYEKRLATYLADLDQKVHAYQRAALASLEREQLEKESALLNDLNSQIAGA